MTVWARCAWCGHLTAVELGWPEEPHRTLDAEFCGPDCADAFRRDVDLHGYRTGLDVEQEEGR